MRQKSKEHKSAATGGVDSKVKAICSRAISSVLVCVLSGLCSTASAEGGPVLITLTGQSMIRGDIRVDAPEAVPTIKSLIKGDAAFTNFEAAVYDPNKGQTTRNGRFASPAGAMGALQSFGFNLLSLSNNHSFDIKAAGIINTLETADRLGIGHAGTGRTIAEADKSFLITTPKGKVGLVALASGLIHKDARATNDSVGVNELRVDESTPNTEDTARILQRVRETKKQAEIVIVSQHNHHYPGLDANFSRILLSELPERLAPPRWLEMWAHQLVDAGADVVSMHGPPFLHGMEIYKGKPIFYSLGNFIFQVPPESIHLEEPIMWESVVAYLTFDRGNQLKGIRLQPIAMNKVGKGLPNPHDQFDVNEYHRTRGLPHPATGGQARFLLERFARSSKVFGTEVEIHGDTAEVRIPRAE